jgi:putative aldouronate transport system permease protein
MIAGGYMKKKLKMQKENVIFNILGYWIVTIFGLFCIIPFIVLISGSFTDEQSIFNNGYSIIPGKFSLGAYQLLLKYPADIFRAYMVTIMITAIGTVVGLFLVSMTAYVLNRKDFKYRNRIAFYFYFTTLFSGGIVPLYIMMIRYLHLKDTFAALILPLLMNVFNIIILRTFMSSLPDSLSESAKVDGAGDFRIFIQLILPLTKPALAAIGLFIALGYWNDWYNAMLYLNDFGKFPLQYMLYNMFNNIEGLNRVSSQANVTVQEMPQESFKMAMAVVVTGPIVLLYPFVQKYFVQGITIGAVKG